MRVRVCVVDRISVGVDTEKYRRIERWTRGTKGVGMLRDIPAGEVPGVVSISSVGIRYKRDLWREFVRTIHSLSRASRYQFWILAQRLPSLFLAPFPLFPSFCCLCSHSSARLFNHPTPSRKSSVVNDRTIKASDE